MSVKGMDLFYSNRVISWHEHVRGNANGELDIAHCDKFVSCCDKAGIDKMLCSVPISDDPFCPPEKFIAANNIVHQAMRRYPDRILGMCFVNPGYGETAISEVKRCVNRLGMKGVKLYHQYFIDDPVLFNLVECCIELDIPILMHAGKVCDEDTIKRQPRLSDGVHFAKIARRYPEANFIMAHIGGGGDWQWQIKAIADTPNVVVDMSGSVHDCPMIEEAVEILGADRILFGTDNGFSSCIGKILGADIPENHKKTILEGTRYLRFIERAGKQ